MTNQPNPFHPFEPPFRYCDEVGEIHDSYGCLIADLIILHGPRDSDRDRIGQTIAELMNRECEKDPQ